MYSIAVFRIGDFISFYTKPFDYIEQKPFSDKNVKINNEVFLLAWTYSNFLSVYALYYMFVSHVLCCM